MLADAYPNFSICGIPYYVSGEVGHWRNLAHRTVADLEATGMTLRLDTRAQRIDPSAHQRAGRRQQTVVEEWIDYDALIVGTGRGAGPPADRGLDRLGAGDGVHLLHSMGDTFALMRSLEQRHVERAVIVGAGYIGLEMAEALIMRGLSVTQLEQLPEVLPTVDPELGALVRAELERHDVSVSCNTRVEEIATAPDGSRARLEVRARGPEGAPLRFPADVVLVVVGVRPGHAARRRLPERSSASRGRSWSTGRCAPTCPTCSRRATVSSPTTGCSAPATCRSERPRTSKAGSPARTRSAAGREFAGSLGTQVVKVFDLVAARTGLRDHEATTAGFDPVTVGSTADDHKAYYPGSHPITMRYTGDRRTGRLLGVQLVGHRNAEIAKRIDIPATAIFNELTVEPALGARSLLHPAARLAVGRHPDRRPGVEPACASKQSRSGLPRAP